MGALLKIGQRPLEPGKPGIIGQAHDQHHREPAAQRRHRRILDIGVQMQQGLGDVAHDARAIMAGNG